MWWNTLGTLFVIISVLTAAPKHQSSEFVFWTFVDRTGVDGGVGWSQRASPAYVALVGMLMAQWTLTGQSTCLPETSVFLTGFQVSMRAHIWLKRLAMQP